MDEMDNALAWEIHEKAMAYLDNHKIINLFNIMEDAIYCKAEEIYAKEHPKEIKKLDIQPIIDYCMSHTIPKDCDRHSKLFKNIAAFLVNNSYKDEQIREIDGIITSNCPGKNKGEIYGWIRWARQKERNVNMEEIEDVAELACKR